MRTLTPQLSLHPFIRRIAGRLMLIQPRIASDGRDLVPARIGDRLKFILVDEREHVGRSRIALVPTPVCLPLLEPLEQLRTRGRAAGADGSDSVLLDLSKVARMTWGSNDHWRERNREACIFEFHHLPMSIPSLDGSTMSGKG
ncbi:MAG TPA: hypothetical protein PKD49_15275 [Hyphomicrobium sp.]|nr:hypothetical protein [Hyphomicrobium sp.]